MKTDDLIVIFGSQRRIAQFLGISQAAVCQWDGEVPELRVYQLKERMPGIEAMIRRNQRSGSVKVS